MLDELFRDPDSAAIARALDAIGRSFEEALAGQGLGPALFDRHADELRGFVRNTLFARCRG